MPELRFEIPVVNHQDQYLEALINGTRYRYHFDNQDFEFATQTIRGLRRHSDGRALAWIKKHCTSWEKCDV